MGDAYEVQPVSGPVRGVVQLPGSKSWTNRALVAAALAAGRSYVGGALEADDTDAMIDCLGRLGAVLQAEANGVTVDGVAGLAPGPVELDARLSGTTARFLLPILALGEGEYRLDGSPPLRGRPMGPSLHALRTLGVTISSEGQPGHLPVVVDARGMPGGSVTVSTSASSQFVSGLLLAGPRAGGVLTVVVQGQAVSRPYLDMTVAVMRAFGAAVEQDGYQRFVITPTGYEPAAFEVEPDASAAAYFFAAAAITGGSVTVPGLTAASVQGDVRFVDILEQMGAEVERTPSSITVRGTGTLRGVDVNLADLSDTAQTLAAVAVHADSPTTVRGIGFIRHKETNRIAHPVIELERCGVTAEETADGFVIHPGRPRPATIETYGDHRMAMSFALLGLRASGIQIADPECAAKTFPGFWATLTRLCQGSA